MDTNIIRKYNTSNTIILGIIIIVTIGLYLVTNQLHIIILIIMSCIGLVVASNNKQKLKDHLIKEKRKFLLNHKLEVKEDETPFVSSEYLQSVLPKPVRMTNIKFNHSAIATGYTENGKHYQIDYLEYNGYVEGSKSKEKKFDLTGYIITLDFDQYQFCNRELLYLNLHSDISKYKFQQKHKLVMRAPKDAKVMKSSMYIHNRLMAYNGFHDKYMKNVIQVIDFNPNLFKKPFCRAAIFDKSKLYFFVDDDLAVDLKLEFHYTQADIDKMVTSTQNQLNTFKSYIEHLATVDQGEIRTTKIQE
ncbi:hypothetical protein R2F61_09585 [Mollicutes bacterium LVI A0078]|nr:hypothetical protein RZE84_09340 [Mollicutes bacterium LVI A0075]WOO90946.1 hypothetical protein R2F61_09585 [Mollicutes bacterium LVI A0078]